MFHSQRSGETIRVVQLVLILDVGSLNTSAQSRVEDVDRQRTYGIHGHASAIHAMLTGDFAVDLGIVDSRHQ